MTQDHTVAALPSGLRGQVKHGTSLRTALRALGVEIESVCAENATCGKCKVLIEEGDFPEYGVVSSRASLSDLQPEETDYLRRRRHVLEQRGWEPDQVRLACQARVLGDVVVTVPEDSLAVRQIVRKSASQRKIEVRPSLRKYLVELTAPTLANPRSDWDRLASGIATSMALVRSGEAGIPGPSDLRIDPACLRGLPAVLRDSNWRVTVSVWNDREVVRVEGGYSEALIGAAVDIGTTTIARLPLRPGHGRDPGSRICDESADRLRRGCDVADPVQQQPLRMGCCSFTRRSSRLSISCCCGRRPMRGFRPRTSWNSSWSATRPCSIFSSTCPPCIWGHHRLCR